MIIVVIMILVVVVSSSPAHAGTKPLGANWRVANASRINRHHRHHHHHHHDLFVQRPSAS